MSIADKTGQGSSITEDWRALDLFTNRYSQIKLFASYINDDPPAEKILYFHGDGGNGKSLLLRYLQKFYCKRFQRDNWEWLKNDFSDKELAEQIKGSTENLLPIASAFIDFGLKTTSENRPKEAFLGLLTLRRHLASYNLKFPVFDFACIWYLYKTNQLDESKLKNLFPAEEMDVLIGLVDIATSTSIGGVSKAVLGLFAKKYKENYNLWRKKRNLDENKISEIQRLNVNTDLLEKLPDFIAEDLNFSMGQPNAPERIILFFDSHESFWGVNREMPEALYFRQDEWLRRLLTQLDLDRGIVAIVSGREPPRWNNAARSSIPEEFIDSHLIGQLSADVADDFLKCAGVDNEDLREGLIKYTEVETNEVHPLFLALAADVILAAKRQGFELTRDDFQAQHSFDQKKKELIERLLSYVDKDTSYAVFALAACRAFNREIFKELGENLNFCSTEASYDTLVNFSFVWNASWRGEGWNRIHDLLRRLLPEQDKSKVNAAHDFLKNFYEKKASKGDTLAFADAIYHWNQSDWLSGVQWWRDTFQKARHNGFFPLCRALLDVRQEMNIPDNYYVGLVSQDEGDFYLDMSQFVETEQAYAESISSYNEALEIKSGRTALIYANKGLVLVQRAKLEAKINNKDKSLDSEKEALAAFNKAIELDYGNAVAHDNKGFLLKNQGDRRQESDKRFRALLSYRKSLHSLNKAIELSPNRITAHLNKGLVLKSQGKLRIGFSRPEKVREIFKESFASFQNILEHDPNYFMAYNNEALTYEACADLELSLNRHSAALIAYDNAIESLQKALKISPLFIKGIKNKGLILHKRGLLRLQLKKTREACQDFNCAIKEFSKSLRLMPNDTTILKLRTDTITLLKKHCKYRH